MIKKLAQNYSDSENPGTDDESRGLAALVKYNSGGWVLPKKFEANLANYKRGLQAADAILAAL